MLAEQIAGLLASKLDSGAGKLPEWFPIGTGRAIAARLAKKDPIIRQWDKNAKAVLRSDFDADAFFADRLSSNETALASYVLVNRMMNSTKRFRQLQTQLQNGRDFDSAVRQTYRVTPRQILSMLASGREAK